MFRLGLAALFALVTIVATFVPVPLPFISSHVPTGDGITLLWAGPTFNVGLGTWSAQIEAVLLAPLILGVRLGTLSQVIYLIAGLSGWPVFYQGGGTDVITGSAAGSASANPVAGCSICRAPSPVPCCCTAWPTSSPGGSWACPGRRP
jgi:biotin transporter BioY